MALRIAFLSEAAQRCFSSGAQTILFLWIQ